MNKIATLFFSILFVSFQANAQVPNGGFEDWSAPTAGGDDAPTEWQTLNTAFTSSVTQSNDVVSGQHSMQLAPLTSAFANAPGIVNITFNPISSSNQLTFHYKSQFMGVDSVKVTWFVEGASSNFVGVWSTSTSSDWTVASIAYSEDLGAINSMTISVTLGYMNEQGTDLATSVDSWVRFDDFSFDSFIGLEETTACEPYIQLNNSGNLDLFPCDSENYSVQIYDVFGRLVLDESAVRHLDVSPLPSGIYLIAVLKNGKVVLREKRFI